MKLFKIGKLIRDRIPHILSKQGVRLYHRELDGENFVSELKEKLLEESEEVKRALGNEELAEELADVMEVVLALSEASGISLEQIEQTRLDKRSKKGGFDGRIYASHAEIDRHNPEIAYFLKRPVQYPPMHTEKCQPDCLFCQFAFGKKPVEFFEKFTHCYAIKDRYPVSNGHLLIIPYEHTDNWFTSREEVRLDMMRALQHLKHRLDAEYNPQGYNIGANCGEIAGQTIMHLHLHLIPRYSGDMEDPKGGVRGVIPSKQKYG